MDLVGRDGEDRPEVWGRASQRKPLQHRKPHGHSTFDFGWRLSDLGSQLAPSDEKIKDSWHQTGC